MTEPREFSFTLPLALPSLNVALRTHWSERHRQQTALRQEVMAAIGGPRHYPRPAFERAKVMVIRFSQGTLDPDNAAASVKLLLDVLKEGNERNPLGLSFIRDDSPDRCELVVTQQIAREAATVVRVVELPWTALAVVVKSKRKPRRYPPKKPSQRVVAPSARRQRP